MNLSPGLFNYWVVIALMMAGFWVVIAHNNLVKKLVGMNILQTAIILFYVSIGSKRGGTIPSIEHAHEAAHGAVHAADYVNPLPHVLMLTAIVVAVSTFGVALALAIRVFQQYGTLEEDEILRKIREP